jgi:hypothetical protein
VLGALAVAAPGAAFVAKLSGDAFRRRLIANDVLSGDLADKVQQHQRWGTLTVYATIGLGLVTLALVYFVVPRSRAMTVASPTPGAAAGRPAAVGLALAFLTALAALVSLYYVVRTGDSGGKAVWSGF